MLIGHTHNERTWTPSHGQPLPPEGYRDLFETLEPRISAKRACSPTSCGEDRSTCRVTTRTDAIDRDQALTIVATRRTGVFQPHPLAGALPVRGELRLNPLYEVERDADQVSAAASIPVEDYEQEYGACRQYLPETM